MKKKVITMSILALLNGFSSSSHALPPSSYNSTAGDTLDLFIAGSSALDPALLKTLSKSFCTAGSMDVYSYNTQLVVLCTSSVALTGGKTKIAVFKNSVGGSINGIRPVADATPLTFISMAALKANPSLINSTVTVASTTGLPAYTTHEVATTATQSAIPKAGFSDVEPTLLGLLPHKDGLTRPIDKLIISNPNALVFGVTVTKKIRDLLQAKEGLVVGSETEANMPNLTKTQLSGIFTGQIIQWSQLGLPVTGDNTIYVARRPTYSGTFEVFDIYFTGATCMAGVSGFVTGNSNGQCSTNGNVSVSASLDLGACMTNYNTANLGAVGMMSTGFVPVDAINGTQNPGNNSYRFIKINSAAPTLLNVVQGKYELYAETSFQYRNNVTGNELTIYSMLAAGDFGGGLGGKMGDPTTIDDIDNGIQQYWGRSGLLALPSNGYTPVLASGTTISSADITANPVHTHTKSPGGYSNNCQPPLSVANTDLFSKP